MKLTRRTFIFVGIAGAAALVAVRLVPRAPVAGTPLDADAATVLGAVVPVMLAEALPGQGDERAEALRATMAALGEAIAGLAPRAQKELRDLFTLLTLPPARWSLAHTTAAWQDAAPADVERFLERLQSSRIALLRAAYDALHQLVLAAWYGQARAWPAIGYPGPPSLATAEAPR